MSVFRQIYLLEKRTMYRKIAEYSNLKAKIVEFFFTKGQFKGKQIISKSNGEFFLPPSLLNYGYQNACCIIFIMVSLTIGALFVSDYQTV